MAIVYLFHNLCLFCFLIFLSFLFLCYLSSISVIQCWRYLSFSFVFALIFLVQIRRIISDTFVLYCFLVYLIFFFFWNFMLFSFIPGLLLERNNKNEKFSFCVVSYGIIYYVLCFVCIRNECIFIIHFFFSRLDCLRLVWCSSCTVN